MSLRPWEWANVANSDGKSTRDGGSQLLIGFVPGKNHGKTYLQGPRVLAMAEVLVFRAETAIRNHGIHGDPDCGQCMVINQVEPFKQVQSNWESAVYHQ